MADAALDAEVRRVDEDRWLASRFAPRDVRERLVALYAVNHEIARTADVVKEAAVGAVRLAWWRDALVGISAGQAAGAHPALAAFAASAPASGWPVDTLMTLIEARARDLEAAPFQTLGDIETDCDATAGGVLRLALRACGIEGNEAFARAGGIAWGITGLLRAEPLRRARGHALMADGACAHAELMAGARGAHEQASALAAALPSEAFPAFGYLAFGPAYLNALERGAEGPALLSRQVRIVAAAATGRL